jgi:hypothetical protein
MTILPLGSNLSKVGFLARDVSTIVLTVGTARSKFLSCLPGSAREPARMASMRR